MLQLIRNLIRALAVEDVDYRIHFALNCGAKSCPPIAFYKAERIDYLFDLATQSFLEGETDFDEEEGIRTLYLKQLELDISGWEIRYKEYSWEDDLANFA